jgi:2-polyprenyl-3-methyl-5-hydroxy-6-metoxy-1,4-benzoquinol methylase
MVRMRGDSRERALERDEYFSSAYFSMRQLCSQIHQIHHIYDLQPSSVLEIGIGNGFTSTFLRNAGFNVTTVDINPALCPDIVCSLTELPRFLEGRRFDLIVCCEVLEHLPFEEFDAALSMFARYANRLFLTIPSYSMWAGFSGFIRAPFVNRLINVGISMRKWKHRANDAHFWELGSEERTSQKNVLSIIRRHFPEVKTGSFELNRYHRYFICNQPVEHESDACR